jgi:hypothetical protein
MQTSDSCAPLLTSEVISTASVQRRAGYYHQPSTEPTTCESPTVPPVRCNGWLDGDLRDYYRYLA